MIALVKMSSARYLKFMHKFGVEYPKAVKDTLLLGKHNGNIMWADAIAKEMKNFQLAFDLLENGVQPYNRYKFIKCHMIFNLKMEDRHCKAQLVTV